MKVLTGWILIVLLTGCNLTTAPTPTLTPSLEIPAFEPGLEATLTTNTPQPATISPTDTLPPTAEFTPTLSASASVGAEVPFPTLYINSYSVSAREGQTIYVNYEVVLDNPGQGFVFLLVLDATGVEAGRLALTETKTDVLEIEAKASGTYTLYVTPNNVRGSYKTSYGTR